MPSIEGIREVDRVVGRARVDPVARRIDGDVLERDVERRCHAGVAAEDDDAGRARRPIGEVEAIPGLVVGTAVEADAAEGAAAAVEGHATDGLGADGDGSRAPRIGAADPERVGAPGRRSR